MTRRKLLQVVLFLLLAVAAGWLYVTRQGGLPGPVAALLSRQSPVAASAPEPAPTAESPAPGARPAPAFRSEPGAKAAFASPSPGARAVPSHPVEGEIDGERFVLDDALIESGTLRLRQLEPPLELELVLPVNPWQIPSERSFEVLAPEERNRDTPLVRVRTAGGAQARAYAARYTLWLDFARERNGALPGRLHLVLPDAAGSRVAGTFVAGIRGFRFIDGRPDLSADSAETLEYLALREILGSEPTLALEDLVFRAARLVPARDDAPASGYLEVGYRANGEALQRVFRFLKEGGRWRVRDDGDRRTQSEGQGKP